ncbi:tRNA lysidine(34) synthetase TilS [Segetibacter sp. 3557_3]|uniref:tRNA lysidine(34) synthetase TilS n=1 Tax=Segetibacter sp. 3557_3 TaxID=2547429 RepID=UPI00105855B5|nr:tRNA lysidine(34) synthetase TilS [Segetibacter sp. 3557_3]TDH29281.1 tRNA lysidine(34) synthetase TilS [Segetibacter sp. 3557_3]
MDLLKAFHHEISKLAPGSAQPFYLVAVSGGVDSVVLCNLFQQSRINYAIAHCNFQLRGDESERDEAFVRSLAAKYSREIFVQKFDTGKYASENRLSTQVAARALRYAWFRSLLSDKGTPGFIVTAHHADDNIETVVMNFFRGTGLKGLAGMDRHFQQVFRPMLDFRKKDILAYAKNHALEFVEDSSNASSNYTRNYFRNELLPALQQVFPEAEENILRNIQRLNEAQMVYEEAIAPKQRKLIEVRGDEEHIPVLKLKQFQPLRTMVWEIIKTKGFSAAQTDEVIRLLDAGNGSYIESDDYRILLNRKWLILSPKPGQDPGAIFLVESTDRNVHFEGKQLAIQPIHVDASFSIPGSQQVACVDAKELQFPLMLRRWKTGDYFYPLGMKKKKKLSRFFIDQKLSRIQKENAWVLESNKRIVWVLGYRIDDRFKLTKATSKAIRFSLED